MKPALHLSSVLKISMHYLSWLDYYKLRMKVFLVYLTSYHFTAVRNPLMLDAQPMKRVFIFVMGEFATLKIAVAKVAMIEI
jgi:hypothetical protein